LSDEDEMTGLAEAILLLAKSKAAKPAATERVFFFIAWRLTHEWVAVSMADLVIFMGLFGFSDFNEVRLLPAQLLCQQNAHSINMLIHSSLSNSV
jgi:hypothetical protein